MKFRIFKCMLLLVLLLSLLLISSVDLLADSPWNELASLNVPRVKARAVIANEKIYIVGGTDADKEIAPVEVYNQETNTWEILGPSPVNNVMPCVAAVDKKIYALSGSTLDKVRRLDGFVWDISLGETKWEPIPGKMTMAHCDGACAVIGKKIYLVSGEDDSLSNEGIDYVKITDVFDTTNYQWSTVAPITPHQREDFDATALGNKIIAIGGQGGEEHAALKWVDIYEADTDSWQHFNEASPIEWEHPRIVAVNNDIYVLTGKGEGGFSNYHLDLNTINFKSVTASPVPVYECAVIAMGGKIYVIGGKDLDGNILGNVFVYDPTLE